MLRGITVLPTFIIFYIDISVIQTLLSTIIMC